MGILAHHLIVVPALILGWAAQPSQAGAQPPAVSERNLEERRDATAVWPVGGLPPPPMEQERKADRPL